MRSKNRSIKRSSAVKKIIRTIRRIRQITINIKRRIPSETIIREAIITLSGYKTRSRLRPTLIRSEINKIRRIRRSISKNKIRNRGSIINTSERISIPSKRRRSRNHDSGQQADKMLDHGNHLLKIWVRNLDSNQRLLNTTQVCYHYTIPQELTEQNISFV